MTSAEPRRHLPFRAVNRRDSLAYDAGLQRHHLLPRQLLGHPAFGAMFAAVEDHRARFEDFRRNGLLLPCREQAALRLGLPLHRGPHRTYTQLVAERIGQIEAQWSRARTCDPQGADLAMRMRVDLLQRALRRYLLTHERRTLRLNRRDTLPGAAAFAELDAMADALWAATEWPDIEGAEASSLHSMPSPMPSRALRAE